VLVGAGALIMRAMDEESGEAARLHGQHPGGAELSNGPAIASLVLGILGIVIQLVAGVVWVIQKHEHDEELKRLLAGTVNSVESPGPAGIVVASLLSLAVGISAIVFGVKGRRLARAEGQGRTAATIGLVLGIVWVAIPILGLLAFLAWVSCCIDTL
jgi:hypothetical protein